MTLTAAYTPSVPSCDVIYSCTTLCTSTDLCSCGSLDPATGVWTLTHTAPDKTVLAVGTYPITVTGEISGYPSSAQSHSFELIVSDPCASTTLTVATIPTLDVVIGSGSATTYQVIVTDSVSSSLGNQDGHSFCGARTFSLSEYSGTFTIDASTGIVSM